MVSYCPSIFGSVPLVAIALSLAGRSAAQTPHEVIFDEIAGDPKAAIPGTPNAVFTAFRDVRVSPDGTHWTLHAKSNGSSTFDDHVLVDGQLLFRESFSVLPWDPTRTWVGGFSHVNNAGQIVVAAQIVAGDWLVVGDSLGSGPWTVVESHNSSPPGVPGSNWTNFFAPAITSTGQAGFVGELASGQDIAHLGGVNLAQVGVTTPSGSSGGGMLTSITGGDSSLQFSADGAHWSTLGTVGGRSAVIVDGAVTLEVGQPVPGAGLPGSIGQIRGQSLDPAGRAFAWGLNASIGRDWVVRDGALIAQEFDPIFPGSSESWGENSTLSPAFFLAAGNTAGDYVVYGKTRLSNAFVLVMNGSEEIIRVGDPIDVDGNGLFDDNTILGGFEEIGGWGDNGLLYAVVDLRTPTFGALGDAVMRFDLGGGLGTVYCQSTPNSTGSQATLTLGGSASVAANDLTLSCDELPTHSFGYYIGGMVQASAPGVGGSQGTLCLGGAIGRRVGGSILNSGASGSVTILANLLSLPTPSGPVTGVAGETWNFQYWYRDANPNITSNFSPGVSLMLQ